MIKTGDEGDIMIEMNEQAIVIAWFLVRRYQDGYFKGKIRKENFKLFYK